MKLQRTQSSLGVLCCVVLCMRVAAEAVSSPFRSTYTHTQHILLSYQNSIYNVIIPKEKTFCGRIGSNINILYFSPQIYIHISTRIYLLLSKTRCAWYNCLFYVASGHAWCIMECFLLFPIFCFYERLSIYKFT